MNQSPKPSTELLHWNMLGFIMLSLRFVQGWIFWGGGSRRFIYDPAKLDPYAPQWMANKLQSTMPGAFFDVGQLLSFLLHHFVFLYVAIIIFSLVELISGLALIFGIFTRAAAASTALISVVLMILFGWQGTTCLDEWTMAVSNFSMALTLILTGSGCYSIDAYLMKRYPHIVQKSWFLLCGSAPWSFNMIKKVGLYFFLATSIFTVGSYGYLRGAIISHYHAGPVSADVFHLSLSNGQLNAAGDVSFTVFVDAGPAAVPIYIMRVEIIDKNLNIIESWEANQLRLASFISIQNSYNYNKIESGMYGLSAPESAKATINLFAHQKNKILSSNKFTLRVYTINGRLWELPLFVMP